MTTIEQLNARGQGYLPGLIGIEFLSMESGRVTNNNALCAVLSAEISMLKSPPRTAAGAQQKIRLPPGLEPQPEGGYVVTCPLLPELITESENVQDALQNANDALAAIVEALKELKRPLPSVLVTN